MMGILGHEDHEKEVVGWVAFDDEQAAEKGELGGLESWIGDDIILTSFLSFFLSFSSFLSSCLLQPSFNLYVAADDSAVYKPPPDFVKEEEEKAKKKKKKAPAKKKYCIEYQRIFLGKKVFKGRLRCQR